MVNKVLITYSLTRGVRVLQKVRHIECMKNDDAHGVPEMTYFLLNESSLMKIPSTFPQAFLKLFVGHHLDFSQTRDE